MVRIVQLRGDNRAAADQYTGAERELTVDTDGDELRLHDGVLAGGHRILNIDQNNLRYQSRNGNLTAITGLAAGPGFLVKRGEDNWALRVLEVNDAGLGLTNPTGLLGNPTISLASTITSTHSFEGAVSFTQNISATGGITGNLTGNVTGNLTGNTVGVHTGNVVGNVTGDLTGNSTGTHTGSVDVQGATISLDAGQIPFAALAGSSSIILAGDERLLLRGIITLWFGNVTNIPAGWVICDGQNGTPDLRNQFVLGAGDGGVGEPTAGQTGGTTSHTHVAGSLPAGGNTPAGVVQPHALTTNQMPQHNHAGPYATNNAPAANYGSRSSVATWRVDTDNLNASIEGFTENTGGGEAHSHGFIGTAVPDHVHGITVTDVTDLRPPYVALVYIMKT